MINSDILQSGHVIVILDGKPKPFLFSSFTRDYEWIKSIIVIQFWIFTTVANYKRIGKL